MTTENDDDQVDDSLGEEDERCYAELMLEDLRDALAAVHEDEISSIDFVNIASEILFPVCEDCEEKSEEEGPLN